MRKRVLQAPYFTEAALDLKEGGYQEAPLHASGIVMNTKQSQIDIVVSATSTLDPLCLQKLELTTLNVRERIAVVGVDVKPPALLDSGTRLLVGLGYSQASTVFPPFVKSSKWVDSQKLSPNYPSIFSLSLPTYCPL